MGLCLRIRPDLGYFGKAPQSSFQTSNVLFGHLPFEVRHVLYSFIEVPPFGDAKEYIGLYLSCRQAKVEIDRIAHIRLRAFLLRHQKIYDEYGVKVDYTFSREARLPPIHGVVCVKITTPLSEAIPDEFQLLVIVLNDLSILKMCRLLIHFIDDRSDSAVSYTSPLSRAVNIGRNVDILAFEFLGPNILYSSRGDGLRVIDFRIMWEVRNTGTNTQLEVVEGWQHEPVKLYTVSRSTRLYGFVSTDYKVGCTGFLNVDAYQHTPTAGDLDALLTWRLKYRPMWVYRAVMKLGTGNIVRTHGIPGLYTLF